MSPDGSSFDIPRGPELYNIAFLLLLKRACIELKIAPAYHKKEDIPTADFCQELLKLTDTVYTQGPLE